ncbi:MULTISPECIES: NAD(P)H-dependent oxidoreductase [unclassified Halomonas]|uniref:NAD(P)H-dependent oxidoreductase n=1 Tax=unclassified Halomonas TaxID=2609666 RepID=UPI001CF2F0FE|nr:MULTISPECIES: NAD(P)H-dependent oxidoreductase [unclassified Halomonas]MCA8865666.1 NAD(P)H-dependent oxidoreductase [Halomonas sp. SBBP1]UZH10520.1 NAD(P)H-dependent oxidoreductase [Halomonas sp. BDJS001]
MTKTLILLFHPDLAHSKANAALAAAAAKLPAVELVDMQAIYPRGIDLSKDGEREARRLLECDRIVLQFPIQWYSTPPLLKAWQDAVLTRMFYIAYESEGRMLEGKPLMVAATAGNIPDAYRPGGRNMFTMNALLAPLQATAHRCGLPWAEPFVLYQANKLSAEALDAAAIEYAATLKRWIVSSTALGVKALEPRRAAQ